MKQRPWELVRVANRWTAEGRRPKPWERASTGEAETEGGLGDLPGSGDARTETTDPGDVGTTTRYLLAELRAIVDAA